MSGALWLLLCLSLRGRITRFLRQLRQPKYLVGFLVGAFWMAIWIGRPILQSGAPRSGFFGMEQRYAELLPLVQLGVALAVAAFYTVSWLLPWVRSALPFREAELHLLLPAPLPRRRLIEFALLRAQVPIAISALVFALLLGGGGLAQRLARFAGLWVFFTAWELHGRLRGLTLLGLRSLPPPSAVRRHLAIAAVASIYLLAIGAALVPLLSGVLSWVRTPDHDLSALGGLAPGPLAWLLTPFRWITGGVFARSPSERLWSFLPALGLIVVLFELVVRSRAPFEEPALERAGREATRRSPARRYRRLGGRARERAPFPLPAVGRPEVAIVWKNLLQISRVPLLALAGTLALVALAFGVASAAGSIPFAAVGTGFGFFVMVFAPFLAALGLRCDLRTELGHLELVRPWPVPAHRLFLAEILAPMLLGTMVGLFGLALVAASRLGGLGDLGGIPIVFLGAGLVPLIAGTTGLLVTLTNLAAMLFPAWTGVGHGSSTGLAASGQQTLFALVMFLALVVGLLPGALLVGLAVLVQWALGIGFAPALLPLWGLVGALPLAIEIVIGARVGGRLWADLDPALEILETP